MVKQFSSKRIAINKANATLFIAVSIAAFITVFSVVACKSLLDQRKYQAKVIQQRKVALKTLKENITAADQLTTSYEAFASAQTNVLGGNSAGDGPLDGDNARIVLDALPSKYDFPALATSIDKLFKDNGLIVDSIKGKDDEVAQAKNKSSPTPTAKEMEFSVIVISNKQQSKLLLELMERSIRPIKIKKIEFKSEENSLEFDIKAAAFYQPEKDLSIKKEVVKP